MSVPAAQAAAARAAAEAAVRAFNVELWTLYSVGVFVTILRTYARISQVGFKNLRADDFLIWLAILFYTTQSTLAFYVVNHGQGLANNSMTETQRATLSPESKEYELRVFGSKVQVAGWTSYVCLIFVLKIAMLVFYVRLTAGLTRRFRMGVWVGFGVVGSTFTASIITIFTGCRPLEKYWQINPDPGNSCQGAVAGPVVWVTFVSSVITDLYLIMIPLSMLWSARLKVLKKIGSTIVLGAGVFVLVCSLLKTIFVIIDPVNGAQAAGEWGTREAFTSVVVTNLPMLLSLIRTILKSVFGDAFASNSKPYKRPTGFKTFSDGNNSAQSRGLAKRRYGNTPWNSKSDDLASTTPTFNESQERIVDHIKMQSLNNVYTGPQNRPPPPNGIVVASEVRITQDRASQISDRRMRGEDVRWNGE